MLLEDVSPWFVCLLHVLLVYSSGLCHSASRRYAVSLSLCFSSSIFSLPAFFKPVYLSLCPSACPSGCYSPDALRTDFPHRMCIYTRLFSFFSCGLFLSFNSLISLRNACNISKTLFLFRYLSLFYISDYYIYCSLLDLKLPLYLIRANSRVPLDNESRTTTI